MKQLKSRTVRILSFLLLALMFVGLIPQKVEAFPGVGQGNRKLTDIDKVEVFDRGAVIDNKYTFIPLFTDKTELTVSGADWKWRNWSSADSRQFRTFNVFTDNSVKKDGSARARYRNVGSFNGKDIDLEIRIMDWKTVDGAARAGNISFATKDIGVSTSGFHWVDMDWKFFEAGTSKPVKVDGYFTISDIDLYQGVNLSNNLYNSIDRILIDDSRNDLWYRRPSNYWHQISTDFGGDHLPDTDYNGRLAFTYTFSNDSMRFQWFTNWSKRPRPKPRYSSRNNAAGEYFMYTDIKQISTGPALRKSVNHTYLSHPRDTNKILEYGVTYYVPKVEQTGYYKEFILRDTVDPILDIQDVRVYDDSGLDYSHLFDISISGQNIVAKASDLLLSRLYFYDKGYRMEIRSEIDRDTLDDIIFDGPGSYEIKNKATLTTDGKTIESNEVVTLVDAVVGKGKVNHRDIDTGELIASEDIDVIPGKPYTVYARYDFKKGSYSYEPLAPTVKSGLMTDGMVVTFWYKLPQEAQKNNGIHIYTNDAGSSQPASIFVSGAISHAGANINNFQSSGDLDLWIEDTSNGGTVWSQSTSVGAYKGVGERKISLNNSYLGVGSRTNYRLRIMITEYFTSCNSEGYCYTYSVVTHNSSLSTHGYKAKLPVIKGNGGEDYVGPMSFSGVILTEAPHNNGVKEYDENITVGGIRQPKLKSGYGYEFSPRIMYSTTGGSDVSKRVQERVPRQTDAKPRMVIDERIVDLSDELLASHSDELVNNYSDSLVNKKMRKFTGQDRISFMLDQRPGRTTKGSGGRELNSIPYHLPKGYLSREDGRIRYSKDSKSVDAGNKMYVPVWIKDLGKYDATLQSTVEIGSHRAVIDIDNIVEVYAYMLSHTDSDTLEYNPDAEDSELDELLLHPMNKDDNLFNWGPK